VKTTNADYNLFKNECQKWIDKLGLQEWEVYYMHEDIGNNEAETNSFYKQKLVYIKLNTEICDELGMTKNQYIKETVTEEILHLLLENLWHYAKSRDFNPTVYRAEEHAIIHRLQKVLT